MFDKSQRLILKHLYNICQTGIKIKTLFLEAFSTTTHCLFKSKTFLFCTSLTSKSCIYHHFTPLQFKHIFNNLLHYRLLEISFLDGK